MPGVLVRDDEPFERALKRFKKACEKAGVISDMKKISTLKNRVNVGNAKLPQQDASGSKWTSNTPAKSFAIIRIKR